MPSADSTGGLIKLGRFESIERLRTADVGRIVYTANALPVVHPVNYIVDGDAIVICTNSATKLAIAGRQEIVAFEVDSIDPASRAGWSVVVTGRAQEITDAVELVRLRGLLTSWVPMTHDRYILIRCEFVTGRVLPPLTTKGTSMSSGGKVDESVLRDAVAAAIRAPSIHNTQPWRWRLGMDRIDLYADPSRQLSVVDPSRRGLLVSCGAALAQARWALMGAGWDAEVTLMPTSSDHNHLATLEISGQSVVTSDVQWLVDAAWRRRTDRRPFRGDPVPEQVISRLRQAAEVEGALMQEVTRPDDRLELAVAVGHADEVEIGDPDYQAELRRWTGRAANDDDGVPASAVPDLPQRQADVELRDFTLAAPGTLPANRASAVERPVLLVLATAGDSDADRLRAGQALARVLLTATRVGLAASPYTQPMEVASSMRALHRIMSGVGTPQIVLRLGWAQAGTPLRLTPRRSLDDVIIT